MTRGKGEIGWWHRTGKGADVIPGIDWNFRRKPGGVERSVLINPEVAYTTPAGDTVLAEIFMESDKVASPFRPVPGVTVDAGSYAWHYLFTKLETAPSTRRLESVLLQWDNVSSRLGISARARWLWTA